MSKKKSKKKRKAKDDASQEDSGLKRLLKRSGAVAATAGQLLAPVGLVADSIPKIWQSHNKLPAATVEIHIEGSPDEMADKSWAAYEELKTSSKDKPIYLRTPSNEVLKFDTEDRPLLPNRAEHRTVRYALSSQANRFLDSPARDYMKVIESGDEQKKPIALAGLATIYLQESIGMPQTEGAKSLERAAQLYTQALSEEQSLGRGSSALAKFAIEGLSVATPDENRSASEQDAQIFAQAMSFVPLAMHLHQS